jgi:hypothetical protein
MYNTVTASQAFHQLFWQCMKILGKLGWSAARGPEAPHDDVLAFCCVPLSLDTAVSRLQHSTSPHTRKSIIDTKSATFERYRDCDSSSVHYPAHHHPVRQGRSRPVLLILKVISLARDLTLLRLAFADSLTTQHGAFL